MSSSSADGAPRSGEASKPSFARNRPGVSRQRKMKSDKYHSNITKRGKVSASRKDKEGNTPMSTWLIGLFVFVVIGSALFQIISQAQSGSLTGRS